MPKSETLELKEFELKRDKEVEIRDIFDMIEVVDTVPTSKPTTFYNQFKIYNNAGTKRFYWYDPLNDVWAYSAGT